MPTENTESISLLVKINGAEEVKATDSETWSTKHGMRVASMTIDMRLDCPDSFEVEFMGNVEGERTVFDWAKEGSEIELGFAWTSPATGMFMGEVVYVEAGFDSELGPTVMLRGFDHSHRLTRGHSAKTWGDGVKEEQVVSDAVSDVITNSKAKKGEVSNGLSPDKVDKTDFKVRYIPKAMGTDYDFIKWAGSNLARASDSGAKDDKKISFRKLDITATPVATACYLKVPSSAVKPVHSIRAKFNIATYPIYAKVRVHGWNVKDKKAFVAEVEACSSEVDCAAANSWVAGWKATGKAHYQSDAAGAVYERVMEFCESKEEAEKVAQGLFDSLSLKYLTGEAEVQGTPDIIPGSVVAFDGFGDRVSGKVLVTQVTHHISARHNHPYTTTFQFCSNAAKAAK